MQALASISPRNFNSFGELLRYLRERAELSQKQLALEVGYHYSYMSRIEKNQRIPDHATLMARFVPALSLDDEPEWTARLLELAAGPDIKTVRLSSGQDAKPVVPPTALPIFDLSSSNLPTILTALLGRDEEVLALTELIGRQDVRLVTLVGPPGVGKTRLAAHLAAQLAGQFAHGPLFVDLTDIPDADSFLPLLARALGIHESSDVPLLKSILASLCHRNLLLVLDNFEQIIDAAPSLPALLVGAPEIKVLVTSREALHVSGEYEFPLSPLPLPGSPTETGPLPLEQESVGQLLEFASVQLFVQRTRSVLPAFKLTEENLQAIAEICRKLDGLPLAIELAAARIKTLNPQSMLQQLDRRLDWLTRGARDANAWRQTLRGTIEWSYNLLSESERALLRRLAVFAGGWTLRGAEVVCSDRTDMGDGSVRREVVLDLLIKLVDKSLVVTDTNADQARYHLLETVREYGNEKLAQAGELADMRNRHLTHFAEYAEEAENHLDGVDQAKWILFTEKEHHNFRSAIDASLGPGADLSCGCRIGAAISLFWIERSYFHEGIERLDRLLEAATAPAQEHARAKMLYRSAALHARLFHTHTAYQNCQQSIEICRRLGDRRALASALFYMGDIFIAMQAYDQARAVLEVSISLCWSIPFPQQLNMAMTSLGRTWQEQGDNARALSTTREALAIAEQIDDLWGTIHALQSLGTSHRYGGEYDPAIAYFERSLPAIRLIGDRFAEGITLANLSILHHLKEDYPSSGHAAEKAFALFQAIGDEVQQPFPLRMMGYAAIQAGNFIRARTLIAESFKGNRSQGHVSGQLACIVAWAACAQAQGNLEKAVTLAASVQNHIRLGSHDLLEPDRMALDRLFREASQLLEPDTLDHILKKGRALTLEEMAAQEFPVQP